MALADQVSGLLKAAGFNNVMVSEGAQRVSIARAGAYYGIVFNDDPTARQLAPLFIDWLKDNDGA